MRYWIFICGIKNCLKNLSRIGMPNFYTRQFQRQMLLFEYNMAVQGTLFRLYVYEKEHPERIIGTICVHHITRGFSEQCEVGYKFSSAYHHRGYATESLRFIMDLVFRDLKLHRAWHGHFRIIRQVSGCLNGWGSCTKVSA